MTFVRGLLSGLLVLGSLGISSIVPAYQERLILARTEGTCVLRVEADDQSRTLRLRILPEGAGCQVTRAAVQATLKAAFATTDPPQLAGPYTSLFLGRLVEYPWLSNYLAMSADHVPRWNKKQGKPLAGDLHQYVRAVLSRPEIITQFDEPLDDSGYRVVAVTVEKVGVGDSKDVPMYIGPSRPGKVPYDALVWLTLERKSSGVAPGGQHSSLTCSPPRSSPWALSMTRTSLPRYFSVDWPGWQD